MCQGGDDEQQTDPAGGGGAAGAAKKAVPPPLSSVGATAAAALRRRHLHGATFTVWRDGARNRPRDGLSAIESPEHICVYAPSADCLRIY